MEVNRHVTAAAGFVAAGIKAGIKASGKEDLAIIACKGPAAVAVVTTQNQIVGAPVLWTRKLFPKGYGIAQAMVINAGCSNVCTGEQGLKDAAEMAAITAACIGTGQRGVLVASTGVIGHPLPMDKIRAGIPKCAAQLGRDKDHLALAAIMTTDTRPKYAVRKVKIGRTVVTLGGMVKGSGMIAPSLATMIAVITTDAVINPALLHKALKEAVGGSFNAATVDSDTSTSDTVVVFASLQADNRPILIEDKDYRKFADTLGELCLELARAVVIDGEGATKLINIAVSGARNAKDAFIAAKSVANSPLFKCAVHGGDPNWGRIACALGKSAAKVVAESLTIRIGGTVVFAGGTQKPFALAKVERHLKGKEITVECDLGLGDGAYTAYTCDLSREYITINADYHT